ncbi:MAG: ABC transporter ATP-binding protein [Spirochaetota bacterium]
MLEIKSLEVYIGKTFVLKGINLFVDRGEVVALLGANGAGKTTTLMTISGLLHPKRGGISYIPTAGVEPIKISAQPPEKIVDLGISHCPEGRQIFTSLNVRENLLMGSYSRKDKEKIKEDLQWVYRLFPRLAERQKQSAGSLSGGEQMMLAIGRALMSRPRLLLLDEPSLGLAPMLVEKLFDTLEEINRAGTTLFLVEQNASMALELARRAYVMETGRVVLSGTSGELKGKEEIQKAYLGITR